MFSKIEKWSMAVFDLLVEKTFVMTPEEFLASAKRDKNCHPTKKLKMKMTRKEYKLAWYQANRERINAERRAKARAKSAEKRRKEECHNMSQS